MHKSNYRIGFTLLELVIVMIILGLLSTIAVTSLSGTLDNYKLTQATEVIQRFDAYARRQAANRRQPVHITVQRLRNQLQVGASTDRERRLFRLPSGVSIGETLFRRKTIASGNFEIRFDQDGGSPSYAMELTRGKRSQWIVVLGGSGQILQMNQRGEVNEILSL